MLKVVTRIELSLVIFVLVCLFALPVISKPKLEPWVNAEVYSQIRRNVIDENDFPFVGYLDAGLLSSDYLELDISLKVMGDPLAEVSRFDLYSTKIVLKDIAELLTVKAGRQSIVSAFSYDLMDGLDIVFHPDFYVNFEVYSGFIRFTELNEFSNYNFATGGRIFLNEVRNTEVSLEFRYEKIKNGGDWVEAGILAGHTFSTAMLPKIYTAINTDITNQLINQVTAGLQIRPSKIFDIGFEVSRHDYKPGYFDPWEDIFTIFSMGPMWELRASTGFIVNRNVSLFQGYSYFRYDQDAGVTNVGHSLRGGIDVSALDRRIRALTTVYFDYSYGGRNYGITGRGDVKVTKEFFVGLKVGFLHYDKITGEKGNASTVSVDAGYELLRGLKVILGAEHNSNDDFKNDLRGNLALKYIFM